jgi:DNA-binding MarR family transcriptional regulator
VTRVAARLEEAGLVVRRVDPADRRVARMTVSAQGRRLLKEIRDRRDAYLAARLQSFTAEERATLSEALPLLERLTGDVP